MPGVNLTIGGGPQGGTPKRLSAGNIGSKWEAQMGETSPKGPDKGTPFPVRKLSGDFLTQNADQVKGERPSPPPKKISMPDFLKRDEPYPVGGVSPQSLGRIANQDPTSPVRNIKAQTPPKPSIIKVRITALLVLLIPRRMRVSMGSAITVSGRRQSE